MVVFFFLSHNLFPNPDSHDRFSNKTNETNSNKKKKKKEPIFTFLKDLKDLCRRGDIQAARPYAQFRGWELLGRGS